MIYHIRHGIWETNSSTVNSICLYRGPVPKGSKLPEKLCIRLVTDFDETLCIYTDPQINLDKLIYILIGYGNENRSALAYYYIMMIKKKFISMGIDITTDINSFKTTEWIENDCDAIQYLIDDTEDAENVVDTLIHAILYGFNYQCVDNSDWFEKHDAWDIYADSTPEWLVINYNNN